MSTTVGRIAVGAAIAFWFGLMFFLSGGRLRQWAAIGLVILALLSLPSQALASCTDSLEYQDGKTVLCKMCCSSNGSCVKTCF